MIREFIDHEGYKHIAEFDASNKCISDKKFDDKGNLVGEGLYKDGNFVGHRTFFTKDGYGR